MAKYITNKIIEAVPMTRGDYNIKRGWSLPLNENGEDAGYFITYPDGYISWCPAEQFESQSAEIGSKIEKVKTIQKREKLNDVFTADEKGNGGAHHMYLISLDRGLGMPKEVYIQLQNGARNTVGAIEGVLDVDLLEIVKHRLECFQAGPYSSRENAMTLTHIEEALMWLNRRVEDRIERNILGEMKK